MSVDVSNTEFLTAIFGRERVALVVNGKPSAYVAAVYGDPSTADRREWGGAPYVEAIDQIDKDMQAVERGEKVGREDLPNTFFSIAALKAGDDGRYRRKTENYAGTYCLFLDDVGTGAGAKIPLAQVKLPPSWLLETSPGNYQAGYILKDPMMDMDEVTALQRALVHEGLAAETDPGMMGATRYGRLPEGYNCKPKYGEPFRHRMAAWNPDRRFTPGAIADGFGLDLSAARHYGHGGSARVTGELEDIAEHPVVEEFEKLGMVKDWGPGAKIEVECPWEDDHSISDQRGTALFQNGEHRLAFKCHHGHCESRGIGDVLAWLKFNHGVDTTAIDEATGWRPSVEDVFGPFEKPGEAEAYQSTGSEGNRLERLLERIRGGTPMDVALADSVLTEALASRFGALEMDVLIDALAGDPVHLSKAATRKRVKELGRVAQQAAGREEARRAEPKGAGQRLEQIRSVAQQPPRAVPDCLYDLLNRYVYVGGGDNAYYDRLSGLRIDQYAINNMYAHLGAKLAGLYKAPMVMEGVDIPAPHQAIVQNEMAIKADAADYAPGKPEFFLEKGSVAYNLYRNEGHEGVAGQDITPWMEHLEWLVPEDRTREHLLDWMAHNLQAPGVKLNHHLVLGGRERVGKDTLLYPLRYGVGEDNVVDIDPSMISEPYQDYLVGTKLVIVQEIVSSRNHEIARSVENKLKPMLAAPPLKPKIRRMYAPGIHLSNIWSWVFMSNYPNAVTAATGGNRYFAVWAAPNTPKEPAYYRQLVDWLGVNNGMYTGCKAVVGYLRGRDLSQFDPASVAPKTEWFESLLDMSKTNLQVMLEDWVDAEEGAFAKDVVGLGDLLMALNSGSDRGKPYTQQGIAPALHQMGWVHRKLYRRKGGKRECRRVWIVRNVDIWEGKTSSEIFEYLEG